MHEADLGICLALTGWALVQMALAVVGSPVRLRHARWQAIEAVVGLERLGATLTQMPARAALDQWRDRARPTERAMFHRWIASVAVARRNRDQWLAEEARDIRAEFRRTRVKMIAPLACWRKWASRRQFQGEPICGC